MAPSWPCWIGVVADDLTRQRDFYREVLGFTEIAAGPGWVHFDLGCSRLLEIVQRTKQPQYDQARYQIGYAVDDIEHAREQLIARGLRPLSDLEGSTEGGGRWCYFRDAERNVFELKERLPDQEAAAMSASTVAGVAGTYFEAWKAGDFALLRSILADEVTFDGPLGHASNAEECVAGLKRMSQIMTDIVIRKTVVDGPDVLTWFDLHTTQAGPLPTVNWRHVENGKIVWIRATFDARPLTSASSE